MVPQDSDTEGREYLNYRGEDDDNSEEDFVVSSYNEADYEGGFKLGKDMGHFINGDDDDYSGDDEGEDMEHYRDRIFGDLQKQIDERKKKQEALMHE